MGEICLRDIRIPHSDWIKERSMVVKSLRSSDFTSPKIFYFVIVKEENSPNTEVSK
jgi:hypothetical protein